MRVTRVSAQPVPRVGVPWAQLGRSSSRYRAISCSSHLITNRRLGGVQGGGTFSIGTMCGWSVPSKQGVCGSNGPVTLGSDYRTILKSDAILLIFKSELDFPILKIYKFAGTLLRFIGADLIARKM